MSKNKKNSTAEATVDDPAELLLGSAPWASAVYGSGPSRTVEGRSRSTKRHYNPERPGVGRDDDAGTDVSEGPHENSTTLLLKLLTALGIVLRWKWQPFQLIEARHGVNAFPDFICDLADERRFVIEVKTNRFLDLDHLREVSTALEKAGLPYLLWTDKWPLTATLKRNLIMMRRAHRTWGELKRERLRDVLHQDQLTLRELREKHDLSVDQVRAAAFDGHVFLNIFQETTDESLVCSRPDQRMVNTLFEATFGAFVKWREDAEPA